MATYTPNMDLLKKNPATEGSDYFNIGTMLNDNWDKIDAFVALVAASIAPAYSSSSSYALGAYCTHGGKLWQCATAIGTGGEAWNESHWTAVTAAQLIAAIPDVPSASTASPVMDGTASAGTSAAWARGDHVHPTDTSRAPTGHAASSDTYGKGTGSNYGHVKLSDSTSSSTAASSGGTAATPAAVKAVNDRMTYGNSDLTAGTSSLTTGVFYAYYT